MEKPMFLIKMLEEYQVQYHDFLLKYTTSDLDSFRIKEIGDNLKILYKHPDPNIKRMSTIMNAIYTHRMQAFMITKRSLVELLKNDPNQHYNSASGSDWGAVRDAMKKLGHFEEIREPKNGKAGVYKLVYQPAIDVLYELHDLHVDSNKAANWFPHMESKLLEYWESESEPEKQPVKKTKEQTRAAIEEAKRKILSGELVEEDNE